MVGIEDSGSAPYLQVAAALRTAIERGELAVGDKLPTARELMSTYEVSPTTTVKAIDELRRDGLVETKRNRGSFVIARPTIVRRGTQRYLRRNTQLPGTGLSAEIEVGTADEDLARRLRVELGAPLSVVHYGWTTDDGRPLQFSTQWEPLELTGGTPIEQPDTTGAHTVIERFDSIGSHVDHVEEDIRTRMPTEHERDKLGMPLHTPVFVYERTHMAGEVPVETADIVIRGDRMVVNFTHQVPPA